MSAIVSPRWAVPGRRRLPRMITGSVAPTAPDVTRHAPVSGNSPL
ncbi:hypothetical protein ACFPM0_29920 [Pseudonocardia sulfidoxydans]